MANIYQNKNYKFYILVPIIMLLISLYFIPKIQLDSSLRGGISVQLITNSTANPRALTALVDSQIPGAQASVQSSPGGLSITMAENGSISAAQTNLLGFYSEYGNYTSYTVNITEYNQQLATNPGNTTLQTMLSGAKAQQQKSIANAQAALSSELSALRPFIGNVTYNASDIAALPNVAKNGYSNASLVYQNMVISKIKSIIPFTSYSYNEVTPTLGAFFLQQMIEVIAVSFVLVAIVVSFIFRTPVRAFSIVFGAANDMIIALGAMGAFGIPLGVASVGGLLMILGYAIDTDVLAGMRVLKRSDGTAEERAYAAFKTGSTMTITAIISFSVLLIVSYFAFIPTYLEISGVVIVGLLGDLVTAWLGNTPMLLWYKSGREAHKK